MSELIYDNDTRIKALLSRVPLTLAEDNEKLLSFLKKSLKGVTEVNAVLLNDDNNDDNYMNDDDSLDYHKNTEEEKEGSRRSKSAKHQQQKQQRSSTFAFITFVDEESTQKAIKEIGHLKYKDTKTNKSHILYIRPKLDKSNDTDSNVCFLWKAGRCTHGDNCKFVHEGDGAVADSSSSGKKKQKCFAFKKKGKCRSGDACPFSHEVSASISSKAQDGDEIDANNQGQNKNVDKSLKDCINWKVKGKCRKGDTCPYRHGAEVREKALAKKCKGTHSKSNLAIREKEKSKNKEDKVRQPLSIRVFGLCYDTTESDIRDYFEPCGKIVEVMFPIFEDSGRSKGYCGILFQSPKAVEKALELNESELHGRWLSVQAGKMYLKQWEENTVKQIELSDKRRQSTYETPKVGELGQHVKRRKKHGFKDDTGNESVIQ